MGYTISLTMKKQYGGAGLYENTATLSILNLIPHPVCDSAETETKYKYNTEENE